MANISKIKLPNNTVYDIKDAGALRQITSSNVTTALGFTPLNAALKGANSGVAELDANGKVPSSQLPSYVDDVLEYTAKANFPSTGETGKIYVDTTTNLTYRWSGTAYVEISPSLALGTTSSTAYRGDYGNAAYTHAVTNKGSAFSSGLYKITTNSEGHVTAATAVAKSDITALGIPENDTWRPIGSGASDAAAGNHTHAISIASATDTSQLKLFPDTNYAITAGGETYVFTTPGCVHWENSVSMYQANNNVSSTKYSKLCELRDVHNSTITGIESIIKPTGEITSFWHVNNYNGSNLLGQIGIKMTLDKNGVFTYTIHHPDKFISALGLDFSIYTKTPLFITTSNSSASDALTYGTTTTLSTGQLVFVTLNKAMPGSSNAILKFGSNTAINIYLTGTTQLKAAYAAGTMLGLVYNGTNLYMINPPVAV